MIEIIVDGEKIKVPKGTTIINATNKVGKYIPHFCYHKKLSVAANCRMCLVEVEKFNKLLPACSTIVSNGMNITTCSEKVKIARKGVLEFLLRNHPLDCPICDQGGECTLQDISFEYGSSKSRLSSTTTKRVFIHKNLGPLISAEEMSRCIHCSRCIRFSIEIAGTQELGILNRGEHSEISSFLSRNIESELSGNMIDICPVGALTSKPFRFSARSWELAHRFSISPHDSLGTNLLMHVKSNHIYRVTPYQNEKINECWISDRDRFSYEGLNCNDRLSNPIVKNVHNKWEDISWDQAFDIIKDKFSNILKNHSGNDIGFLASNYSTLEELLLISKIAKSIGSDNIDFRIKNLNIDANNNIEGIPWLGMPISEIENLDRILIIGSNLRNDHPLLALKFRKAVNNGAKLFLVDSCEYEHNIQVADRITVSPLNMVNSIAEICIALLELNNIKIPECFINIKVSTNAKNIALHLFQGKNIGIFIDNSILELSDNGKLLANSYKISQLLDAKFGFLLSGSNTIGGYLANAYPINNNKNTNQILEKKLKSYIILHAEPSFDFNNPAETLMNLAQSEFSIALTPYASEAKKWAKMILPIAPFSETSGTFINNCGYIQSFKAVILPFKETRPGWKILRVLANILDLDGFEYTSSLDIKDELLSNVDLSLKLSNNVTSSIGISNVKENIIERIADIPIYKKDPIVRRARSLQNTKQSEKPCFIANNLTLSKLKINNFGKVKINTKYGTVILDIQEDNKIANNCVKISAGFEDVIFINSAFTDIKLECI
ncbi:NADH-quinone oxidoreductase subunit NuoG [Candidatus Kinetoplastibacterium sorsogonicusi]|nr:NADH-quinone oxidoreductase subunit NuoG [Candidatus Kinetoplastibacterium sorsogonicusi]